MTPGRIQDVSRILKVVNITQSHFAIRSGGHDFNVNHSSVGESGILVDLGKLNQTMLNADKSNMTIGVGARWGDVYKALDGSGVSVNGARSPNPAVGGQTLGGGIGWFTNLAGVCAASVIAAEVVLANSSVVAIDGKSSPDLLWALKGGGPNFGVVVSFTYATIPIDKMWFEARTYGADMNKELLNALVRYQDLASNDTKANIVYQLSANSTDPQSFVGFLYLEPLVRPSIFKPFYDVPHLTTRINSTVGNLETLATSYYSPAYPQAPPRRCVAWCSRSLELYIDPGAFATGIMSFQCRM